MKIKYLLLAALLGFTSMANAVSLNLSYVKAEYDYTFPANIVLDDSSSGLGVTLGLPINSHWAVDVGYTDLGSAAQTFLGVPTEFESTMLSVALHGNTHAGTIATYPVKIHGFIGAAQGKADLTINGVSLSSNDIGLYYGGGFSLWFNPNNALTLMLKDSDLTFENNVMFDYDPKTIEVGWTHNF